MSENEDKEYAAEFSKDANVAIKSILSKHESKIHDAILLVNWKEDYRSKAYPAMIVDTTRNMNSKEFDPTTQVNEISTILNMAQINFVRQFMNILLQHNMELQMELAQIKGTAGTEDHAPQLKIVK